jgi:prevent-host-death family protein
MIYKETAMKVRHNLGELLNKVQYRHDSIVITKAEKPIAALVDIQLFEKIRTMKTLFEQLSTRLAKTYEGIDSSIAEAEINEAITAIRRKRKKQKSAKE